MSNHIICLGAKITKIIYYLELYLSTMPLIRQPFFFLFKGERNLKRYCALK